MRLSKLTRHVFSRICGFWANLAQTYYTALFLKMGNGVCLNERGRIVCNIAVTIGDRCLIASDVVIMDDVGHPVGWRERHTHWSKSSEDSLDAPIVVEDNGWIGTRVISLKGVHVGTGAVIAAGTVVTDSVPSATLVAGVPARVIRGI